MKREQILAYSIPLLFSIGIVAFFIFQKDFITLNAFIMYLSSLSTVIMVLIYLFTTSQQLNAMQNQLFEMQYTRNVQSQPLLNFSNYKIQLSLPKFRFKPAKREDISFLCQIIFTANVENIGNSPATSIDIIPSILSESKEKLAEESLGGKINVVSLKENDSKNILCVIDDSEHKIIEHLVEHRVVFLQISTLYKNVLGMTFRQNVEFIMPIYLEDVYEKLVLCLKTTKTLEIDFTERIEEYKTFMKRENYEDASKKLDEMNVELEKRFGSQEEFEIPPLILSGSFSVNPITELEYSKIISEKEERARANVAPWTKVPWFLQVERDKEV